MSSVRKGHYNKTITAFPMGPYEISQQRKWSGCLLRWAEGCPSERANSWLRSLPFSKGSEGSSAALYISSSFPTDESSKQRAGQTGRSGRKNSWILLIILWLEAVALDTCYPPIFAPALSYTFPYPTPSPSKKQKNKKQSMIGIVDP